jgi:hypothetical protein
MGNWLESLENRNEAGHLMGTTQDERLLAALDPDYVGIDESDLTSFVDYLMQYAELIAFYDTEDRLAGSWRDMLGRSALLALISQVSSDPKVLAEHFHTGIEQLKAYAANGREIKVFESPPYQIAAGLFAQIENLKLSSRRITAFNQELIILIQQNLAPIYKRFVNCSESLADHLKVSLVISSELPIAVGDWQGEEEEDPAPAQGLAGSQSIENYLNELVEIFTELLQVVTIIRESAEQYIRKELVGGKVLPHTAALLGFFEMMKVAYQDLNHFTTRHLNYYYQEILNIKQQPERPDHAHVVFALAENVSSWVLEADTALVTGPDSKGLPRIYKLDRGISLNRARLVALKAVIHDAVVPSAPLLSATAVPVDTYMINSKSLEAYARENIALATKGDTFFTPGFAIASAIWHVEPTTSMLKMTITCDVASLELFKKGLGSEWNAYYRLPVRNQVAIADKNKLIKNLFSVEYSIDGGLWYELPAEQVELCLREPLPGNPNPFLDMCLLLHPDDPAIAACTEPAFPDAVARAVPVFRFLVAAEKLHLYQLFSSLIIHKIDLEANVLDLRNLILQNDYGLLDPNVPFMPFGPVPTLGSNFYIGHQRIFDYPLHALKINIEWFQLPTEKEGFAGHYQDYDFDGDNHAFKALLSILDKKNWWPKQHKQLLSLFQSVSLEGTARPLPKDRLSKIRRINEIDLDRVRLKRAAQNTPVIALDKETLRGFLRLQLAEPLMAFGHQLFPEILTRQITEAARKKKLIASPNQPYTPTVKNISLDYSSAVSFSLQEQGEPHQELFYHIHPFGVVRMNDVAGKHEVSLLPAYAEGAHLYLGIEGLGPQQPLSILFQISDDGLLDYKKPLELTWSYLSGGRWIELRVEERLFDTTMGLTKSGVMGFKLLGEIDPDLKLLPDNLTWISCVSNIGTQFLENLIDIKLQAAICTFENNGNALDHLEAGLPPGSIVGLQVADAAIATVTQPYASFGGRPAEDARGYNNRVSELLRHKDRAINGWDYENLVLEQFPEIRKAICLSHIDVDGRMAPGYLLLTVIPRMRASDRARGQMTRVSAGLLDDITRFIQNRCATFVKVKVTNAVEERILVSAGIKLKRGYDDHNFYLNKLNQSLRKMLSPWYYQDDLSAGIAVKVFASTIIEFIDNQPYVDFVSNFRVFQVKEGKIMNAQAGSGEYEIIKPSVPNAVLLSVENHHLSLITDENLLESGIGGMSTQVDLIVPLPDAALAGIETTIVQKDLIIPDEDSTPKRSFTIKIARPKI